MTSQADLHWQGIHSDKFQDVSWWQNRDDLWLDLLEICPVPRTSSIIDIGSGASLLADALLELGFADVNVMDISQHALARVRERLAETLSSEHFFSSDVRTFRSDRTFDVWHDRAVFHFLTSPKDQQAYKDSLHANLGPEGFFIISTFALDGPETCSGLPVSRYDKDSLLAIFGEDFECAYSDTRLHSTPWQSVQSFTRAILRKKKTTKS